MSLEDEELDFSYSYDVDLEYEVTSGYSNVEDLFIHSSLMFCMSSNMDSEVHIPSLSCHVDTSFNDGPQLCYLLDVFLARSRF